MLAAFQSGSFAYWKLTCPSRYETRAIRLKSLVCWARASDAVKASDRAMTRTLGNVIEPPPSTWLLRSIYPIGCQVPSEFSCDSPQTIVQIISHRVVRIKPAAAGFLTAGPANRLEIRGPRE